MSVFTNAGRINDIFINHDGVIKKVQSGWINQNGIAVPVYEKSKKQYKISWKSGAIYPANASGSNNYLYFYPSEIQKITLNGFVRAKKTSASITGASYILRLYGTPIGGTAESIIKNIASVKFTETNYNTVSLDDYMIDLDTDIDWTKWDKEKPISFRYSINTMYTAGDLDIEFNIVSRGNTSFNVQQLYSGCGYSSSYLNYGRFGIYNPQSLRNVKLDGTLSAYNQSGFLTEGAYEKSSGNLKTIEYIAKPTAGDKMQLDANYIPVDWDSYNAEQGLFFTVGAGINSSTPGTIGATITYTILY